MKGTGVTGGVRSYLRRNRLLNDVRRKDHGVSGDMSKFYCGLNFYSFELVFCSQFKEYCLRVQHFEQFDN